MRQAQHMRRGRRRGLGSCDRRLRGANGWRSVGAAAQAAQLRVPQEAMMANEFRTLDSHSAEHFGDTRDYWWNLDFLELMGRRLSLDRVQDVLDIGCGVGHWGKLLGKVCRAK